MTISIPNPNRNPKRRHKVRIKSTNGDNIDLQRATSIEGNDWVKIKFRSKSAWVRYDVFGSGGRNAFNGLRGKGVVILQTADERKIIAALDELKSSPHLPIIERPGWSGLYFALPDGTVFRPEGMRKGIPVFDIDTQKCCQSGTMEEWRDNVAKKIVGQNIPTFMVMAAFAAPLLALSGRMGNLGFEICGKGGAGKSTAQRIMASVVGPTRSDRDNYMINFYATPNGLEQAMSKHVDLPMIIDEANQLGSNAPESALRKIFLDMAFQLATGSTKARYDSAKQEIYRFLYVTSANLPLHIMLRGADASRANAALDRLMSIEVSKDSTYGIFDSLPEGYSSSAQLARSLESAIENYYGTAFCHFIDRIVKKRASEQDALKRRIRKMIDEFKREVHIDENSGSDVRVAEAFGLVYAAGAFAKGMKILPPDVDCLQAAVACYENHKATAIHRAPLIERLHIIADRPETLKIDKKNLPNLSNADVAKHGAFLWRGVKGRTELLFTDAIKSEYFHDWPSLKDTPDFLALNERDVDRPTLKRRIRCNGQLEAFLCFKLPLRG